MRTALVFQRTFAERRSTMTAALFRLGMNAAGLWVICEVTGRKGGLFRTRQAAIKYARSESVDGNFTIVHEPNGLELAA
jgi:hypothetical protein